MDIKKGGQILHKLRGHDDDILGDAGQLLDAKVDEPPQHGVPGLEQLRDREEAFRGLGGSQSLALIDQVENLGENSGALPRVHRSLIEQSRKKVLLGIILIMHKY